MRTCKNCGGPLPPKHRIWCKKKKCQRKREKQWKTQMLEHWKLAGGTRRRPDSLKPIGHPDRTCQYPPNATKKCGKPLTGTANYFYCPEHAKKIGDWEGIEASDK